MIHSINIYLARIFVEVRGDAIGIDVTNCYHIRAEILLKMTSHCLITDVTRFTTTTSIRSLHRNNKQQFKHMTRNLFLCKKFISFHNLESSKISHLRVDAFRITMASAVVDFAFVYISTNLYFCPGHLDTDTFGHRSGVTCRTSVASVSGMKIDAPYSGKTGSSQLAFVGVVADRAVTHISQWTRTASVSRLNLVKKHEVRVHIQISLCVLFNRKITR